MRLKQAWQAAWQQCYDYHGLPDTKFDESIASLRLAFYLATFGMFRASAKTRELQLADFGEISSVTRKYLHLRGLEPERLADRQSSVEELLEALTAVIEQKLDVKPTPTLVTKIALGTVGCVPAYDRYVVAALKKLGYVGRPTTRGLAHLYSMRESDLVRIDANIDPSIPFMRSLDIALMSRGELLLKKSQS